MILAEKSESIKKAVLKLHELTGEEKIRLQCEARERYWMDWQSSMKASRKEGREEGRQEERKNTEYEKKRADEAEKQVKKLRELLEKNGNESAAKPNRPFAPGQSIEAGSALSSKRAGQGRRSL